MLERAAIDQDDRKDTFLIIDEAASYSSSNIDDLLTEARKYRCGWSSPTNIWSRRVIRFARLGVKHGHQVRRRARDARAMALEMRTTPDFILNQPEYHFAARIRNVTPSAVSIPMRAPSRAKYAPNRSFAELIEVNRQRVSLGSPPERKRETPDEGASEEYESHRSWHKVLALGQE